MSGVLSYEKGVSRRVLSLSNRRGLQEKANPKDRHMRHKDDSDLSPEEIERQAPWR
jgi:hypothetical protein